jgi:hypothetical protein
VGNAVHSGPWPTRTFQRRERASAESKWSPNPLARDGDDGDHHNFSDCDLCLMKSVLSKVISIIWARCKGNRGHASFGLRVPDLAIRSEQTQHPAILSQNIGAKSMNAVLFRSA